MHFWMGLTRSTIAESLKVCLSYGSMLRLLDCAMGKEPDKPQPEINIPLLLHCPQCNERHIDEGVFATKPHHTHACQHCGHCWRPAIVNTTGVRFLPGFKNME